MPFCGNSSGFSPRIRHIILKCNCRSYKMWGSSSEVKTKTATIQKHIRLINTDSRSLWCFVPRKKLNHNLLACGLHRPRYIDCLEPLFCSAVATLLASKSELLLREMTVSVTEEVFLKEKYINSGIYTVQCFVFKQPRYRFCLISVNNHHYFMATILSIQANRELVMAGVTASIRC